MYTILDKLFVGFRAAKWFVSLNAQVLTFGLVPMCQNFCTFSVVPIRPKIWTFYPELLWTTVTRNKNVQNFVHRAFLEANSGFLQHWTTVHSNRNII